MTRPAGILTDEAGRKVRFVPHGFSLSSGEELGYLQPIPEPPKRHTLGPLTLEEVDGGRPPKKGERMFLQGGFNGDPLFGEATHDVSAESRWVAVKVVAVKGFVVEDDVAVLRQQLREAHGHEDKAIKDRDEARRRLRELAIASLPSVNFGKDPESVLLANAAIAYLDETEANDG